MASPHEASPTIITQQRTLRSSLSFADTSDFDDARRGLLVALEEPVVAEDVRVLWDNSTYDFDAIAIQVDGLAALEEKLTLDVVLTDVGERYRLWLSDGVLVDSGDKNFAIVTP